MVFGGVGTSFLLIELGGREGRFPFLLFVDYLFNFE